MKKRNLLSLGALVLSLGLTVTSCAGEQGDKGDKGDTGAKGDKGDKGADGKTYLAIIVDEWKFDDVKVTQDKYFVEPGETVTFTFEAMKDKVANKTGEILSKLEFNGESVLSDVIVADENGKATYVLTTAKDAQGYQMTEAEFGSAKTLAQSTFKTFWKNLVDSDKAITTTANNTLGTTANTPASSYSISEADLEDKAETEFAKIAAAVTAAGDNATAKAKYDAAKTAEEAAEKAVKELYDNLLTAKKTAAKADIKTMSDAVKSSYSVYKDADQSSILSTLEGEVDACTSVAALDTVVKGSTALSSSTAKSNKLYALKSQAFGEVKNAFDGLATEDSSDFNTDGTFKDTVATLLSTYGIDSSSSLKSVKESYDAKISEATSFELVGGTDTQTKDMTKLGHEGAEAIKSVVKTVKEELANNILEKYKAEIENSTSLASAPNAKTGLLGTVETIVANFVNEDTDEANFPISLYVQTTGEEGSGTTEKPFDKDDGLVFRLETALNNAIVTGGFTRFATERITNAKVDALKAFKDELDRTLADEVYKTAITVTTSDSKKYVIEKLGKSGAQVDNPFYTLSGTATSAGLKEAGAKELSDSSITAMDKFGNETGSETITYSTQDHYDAASNVAVSSFANALAVKDWQTTHVTDFAKIYKAAKLVYANAQRTANVKLSSEGTYIKTKSVTDKYDELVYTSEGYKNGSGAVQDAVTCSNISSYASQVASSASLFSTLDSKIKTYYDASTDSAWKDAFGASDTALASSTLSSASSVSSLISDVLKGNKGEADITALDMASLHDADVETALTATKGWMNDKFVAEYVNTGSTEEGSALKARYDAFIALVGNKVTIDDTESNVIHLKASDNGELDFTGTSLDSVKTIEEYFNLVVPKAASASASASSLLINAEKDYVASKFDSVADSTLGASLQALAGKHVSASVTGGDIDATSGTKAVASVALNNANGTDSVTESDSALDLDFTKYANFTAFIDAVLENAGKDETTLANGGTVYAHVSTNSTGTSWTLGAIEGSLTHALDNNGSSDVSWGNSSFKSTLAGYIGGKITLVASSAGEGQTFEIQKGDTHESLSAGKVYKVINLSNDDALSDWNTVIVSVATVAEDAAITTATIDASGWTVVQE